MENNFSEEINQNTDLDARQAVYKAGLLEGMKHIQPAPETLARLSRLEISLEELTRSFIEHSKYKEEKLDIVVSNIEGLSKQMEEFKIQMTPIKDYFDKGGFLAKTLLALVKLGAGATITIGGVLGAWTAIKYFIHGQN